MIDTPAKIDLLKKIHLFYGLGDDELSAVAEQLSETSYPAGGVIFQQDSKPESFYLIYGGNVRIVRKKEGKERQLAVLVKNDYFGEMALVTNRHRSGTATAVTDTSLLVLPRENFYKLVKSAPHLRSNLDLTIHSRELARRLQFKWLAPDEVIYFLARKHRIILYRNLILPVLALLVPTGLFYAWFAIASFTIVAFAGFASLIAIVLWAIWLVIDWGNDYYIVTNRRVVWLEKVIGMFDSRQESPLSTILSVGVETEALGRIFDFGNLIVRTFVGRILFSNVDHPQQAQRMIEEYWNRTKEQAVGMEKEAMKDAIRKRLGIALPLRPRTDPVKPADFPRQRGVARLLRLLGANRFRLRYEKGDTVIYRKHWFVLLRQAWIPILGSLSVIVLFFYRLFQLALLPDEKFISLEGGLAVDAWAGALFIAFFPLLAWFVYEAADWSNDIFEVTNEQIIDLDKRPFGTESRNAAQLENILGTEYRRLGILGEIFNYGTVYITVGGSKLAFEDVIDPASVQSDIDRRRMARATRKKEAEITAERERMAEWLATYHKNAREFMDEENNKNRKPE
ncbi:MAG: cyclic nucleotide-binding domain-containing protein [Chloroflexota bacterium]